MAQSAPVERYDLYGEPRRRTALDFLHVEPIPARSRRHAWTIRPHAHADLHQIIVVTGGGGLMRLEGSALAMDPPALLVIPSGTVHGFAFVPGTDGWVGTIAEGLAAEIAGDDPHARALLAAGRGLNRIDATAAAILHDCFAILSQELGLAAPARRLAIRAGLSRLFATAARLVERGAGDAVLASQDVALTERFRRRVEESFRSGMPVSAHARALGVSEDRLLAACQARFGEPPLALIHRRIVVEAQRWLLYTPRPIGEIGRELGFADPAYFSRFFRRRTGETPRAFRSRAGASLPEA